MCVSMTCMCVSMTCMCVSMTCMRNDVLACAHDWVQAIVDQVVRSAAGDVRLDDVADDDVRACVRD